MKKDLPNNLRLNTKTGQLFCADGTDLNNYIATSPINKKDNTKLPVVILSREDFIELQKAAWLNAHLIQAA